MRALVHAGSVLSLLLLSACAHSPSTTTAASTAPQATHTDIDPATRLAFFINDIRQGRCDKIAPGLAAGLGVNAFDTLDQTPLIAAVSHNQLDCARQLIDAGADVNLADNAGWSPLIHSAYFGSSVDLMTLLIDKGAKLDAQNNRGLTALYMASASAHEPQVELLLARGADPKIATQSGYTALRVAQLRGLTRISELLGNKSQPTTAPQTSTH